ncbi:hypothetical protein TP70_08540 [Staphylococcus microti]|uniref:Uncharacterized protein n=1 Tax=Staphylococcus microti TaxID=569857 RepID=A0A0D6XPW5_9STAP|nr:DUF6007 family protein [Staphylococcus microti]KIX90271.1 hypothetical protein TP70_08540 [Staphylococcus microti]PNZ82520.1 hypothetical protein CD132_04300 [Staphylococcus microti]SUM57283.1 Uncharacterised protein [Staphylococcus microti]
MNKNNHLDENLKDIGILDLIFFIPSCLLFSYLPSDYWWQILVNLIIIILTAIGLTQIFYLIKSIVRKK